MNYDADEYAVYEVDIAGGTADPDGRYGWSQGNMQQQYAHAGMQHGSAAYGQQGHHQDHISYHQSGIGAEYSQFVQAAAYVVPGPQIPEPVAVDAAHAYDDSLKVVKDLPPAFHPCFSFRYFNPVQSECFDVAYKTDTNMVVSAPTGAGKTGVLELAMLRVLSKHLAPTSMAYGMQHQHRCLQDLRGQHKMIYLGPIKALVQERQKDWQQRFAGLGLKCVQLTGDVEEDNLEDELLSSDIICSTPEKFDQVTRRLNEKGNMGFFAEIALVMVDEVHLLGEAGRGSSLEAGCVCRLKAIAACPEMAKAQIANLRFVAVSATIPNIADIAAWLHVPQQGLRQYGDELRPCKLTTHVKGYNPAKNDFLFERRLNEYVYGIVSGYCNGRPALVFCNSRKGTIDTASILVKEAEANARGGLPGSSASTGSVFVKTQAQLQRLQAAATRTKAKALTTALVAGVGFHNAAMEPADRELVEQLFKASDLAVLCTTTTLAMGVNLPAHLVVIKGTTRYVGDQEAGTGDTAGYKEYSQTEMLQMVGRAGRPQFDTEGVAVIMTSKDNTNRYRRLLSGQEVESCLMSNLPEHLNAEVVLGTIKDLLGAIQWIRSTFLFTRAQKNPHHYGLTMRPGMSEIELNNLLKDTLIMQPVSELMRYGLIATDEDSFTLQPTGAGKLMATHALKLNTMAAIASLGQRPNIPSLLRVICGAEEFKNTTLRRSERKVLNDVNHSTDAQQLRYHVMVQGEEGGSAGKIKQRITTAQEKLFILLNDGLADKPAENLDYSLKQEQDRLLVVGQRIAKCMAKYYALQNSFSAAGRSLLLARSLRVRLWDDSSTAVRQLPSVGKLLGARLAAAGLGTLTALAACNDAHQVEVAAQKPYPWGSELLAHLRSITPPSVSMQLQVLNVLPNRTLKCQLTLTRTETSTQGGGSSASTNPAFLGNQHSITSAWGLQRNGAVAAGPAATAAVVGEGHGSAGLDGLAGSERKIYTTFTPCKLLCGCSTTDQLLLLRHVVLETFVSPLKLQFKVDPPADLQQPVSLAARLVLDRVSGLDEKASLQVAAAAAQTPGAALAYGRSSSSSVAGAEREVHAATGGGNQPSAARSKRRMASSSCLDNPEAADDIDDVNTAGEAAAAAVKRHCGPQRQWQQQQLAQSMQLSHQQMQQWNHLQQQHQISLDRLSHSNAIAPHSSRHTVHGVATPGQQQQQQVNGYAVEHSKPLCSTAATATTGGEHPDLAPAADITVRGMVATNHAETAMQSARLPKTAIAARYNKILKGDMGKSDAEAAAAASAVLSSIVSSTTACKDDWRQQQHEKEERVMCGIDAGGIHSEAAAATAAAAVDATGVQVTPEHRLVQQEHEEEQLGSDSQQQQQQHNLGVCGGITEQHQRHNSPGQLPNAHYFGTPASSMASLFDMMADELALEEEQQQHAQQQQRQTLPSHHQQQRQPAERLQDVKSAIEPAAVTAAAPLSSGIGSSKAQQPCSQAAHHAAAATAAAAPTLPSLNTVFAAAALQQHDKYRSMLSESRSSALAAAAAAAAEPCSPGNSMPAPTKPSAAAEALCTQHSRLPRPPSHAPAIPSRSSSGNTSSTQYQQPNKQCTANDSSTVLQQQQQQQRCQKPSLQELQGSSVRHQPAEESFMALKGNCTGLPSVAAGPGTVAVTAYAVQVLGADLFTTPKQVLRAGGGIGLQISPLPPAAAAAAAAGNSTGRGRSSNWSTAMMGEVASRRAADVGGSSSTAVAAAAAAHRGSGQQQHTGQFMPEHATTHATAHECDYDDHQAALGVANFQQFAFAPGGSTGPVTAATYRPSQNSLMFQQNSQLSSQSTGNRATAQAKLLGGRARAATQQQASSMNSSGSLLGSSSSRPNCSQQQEQFGPPSHAPHSAVPAMQWGTFVDSQQQQQQQQQYKPQLFDMLSPPAADRTSPLQLEQGLRIPTGTNPAMPHPVQRGSAADWSGSNTDYVRVAADAATPHSQEKQQAAAAAARRAARAAWQPAANGPGGARHLVLGKRPPAGTAVQAVHSFPVPSDKPVLNKYTSRGKHHSAGSTSWVSAAAPPAPWFGQYSSRNGAVGGRAACSGVEEGEPLHLMEPGVPDAYSRRLPAGAQVATVAVDSSDHLGHQQLGHGSAVVGWGYESKLPRGCSSLPPSAVPRDDVDTPGQPLRVFAQLQGGAAASLPPKFAVASSSGTAEQSGLSGASMTEEAAPAFDDLDLGAIFDFMK